MDVERARQVRRRIVRLAQSGLGSSVLVEKVEPLMRAVIPFDRACWHNVDPATSMLTSVLGDSAPTSPLLPVLEYGTRDVNQYSDLARGPVNAAGLRAVTRDMPCSSRRYREILQPMQAEDELTASFVIDSTFWGCARLYRSARWPAFDAVEIAFVASLAAPLAQGFRTALLRSAGAVHSVPEGPGLVLLNGDGTLASVSPAAERWLSEVMDDMPVEGAPLPRPLLAVASRARAIADDGLAGLLARCRVPTRSGRWLVLHGEQVQVAGEDRVSVIVEPAPAVEIAPLIACAYGLTEREQQVMRCVLHGMANKEIAQALGLSPYTVSDHVRLIFEKVGVHSRTELAARVFFEHCYPRMAGASAIGTDGWFVEAPGGQRWLRG